MKQVFILFFSILLGFSVHAQSCDPVADSLELVNLFNSTNGINWNIPWDLNTSMDTWLGVTLTTEGCVQKIVCNGRKLMGPIPDLNLPFLKELSFFANDFADTVPDFSQLPSLEILNLANSDLNGNIPDFSHFSSLKSINLSGNDFTGDIPDFSQIATLEVLILDQNRLLDDGPIPDFSNLPNLKKLSLWSTNRIGSIPDFSGLPNLESLVLNVNNLTGNIPDFSQLPNLKELTAPYNQLSGSIPDFSGLPKLENLDLFFNKLGGNLPDFSGLPNLRFLKASRNEISGTIPDFSNLPRLQMLWLSQNQLTGSIPDFSGLDSLYWIRFSINQLTGPLPGFTQMPLLKYIELTLNNLEGPIPDYSLNTQLRIINLSGNQISGEIPAFQLSELTSLVVGGNNLEGHFPDLVGLCPKLKDIQLGNNNLTYLPDLNGLVELTDLGANNNKFSFDDLLPHRFLDDFLYTNQRILSEDTVIYVPLNAPYKLHLPIDSFVTNNTYNWFKNGVPLAARDSNSYWIDHVVLADSGAYTCRITNPDLPALTLEWGNIILKTVEADAIADFEKAGLKFYPNPVGDYFRVEVPSHFSLGHDQWKLEVADLNGKTVAVDYGVEGNSVLVDSQKLVEGIYFCKFTFFDEVYSRQFLK